MDDKFAGQGEEWPPEDVREAERLLPAWFTGRMMCDNWSFGLLMGTGDVLCISRINRVSEAKNGAVWIDVELLPDEAMVVARDRPDWRFRYAPTERLEASVNAAHVVAAFELADT